MQKTFWSLFRPAPGARRFTLEELRDLYGVLLRNPVVSEANRGLVVETLRSVAEYIIYGDKHDPRIFDFFLENNIMTYLHQALLQPANRSGEVAKQVLQTLSIIIQNVRSETAVFFLFSNNHINNIVDLDFDFDDEEVLGYYVSFLKTISLKLNRGTVQFFINTQQRGGAAAGDAGAAAGAPGGGGGSSSAFPLYTRAVRLAHNREGMVRAAVRTLTLHVYAVPDPAIQEFVTSPPASQHFADVARYLAEQIQLLDRRMAAAEAGGGQALGSLDSQLAEVEDVLSYVSDLLSMGVPGISQLLAGSLWDQVVHPLLLRPLMDPGAAAVAAAPLPAPPQQAQSRAAIQARGSGSLAPGGGSPGRFEQPGWANGPSGGASRRQPNDAGAAGQAAAAAAARVRPVCAVFVLERLFHLVMYPPLLQQLLLVLACGGGGSGGGGSGSGSSGAGAGSGGVSCRSTLLAILSGDQPYPAVMVLRLLVAALNNRHISPELLAALSLLPRKQQLAAPGSGSGGGSQDLGQQLAALVQLVMLRLQGLTVGQQPRADGSSAAAGEEQGAGSDPGPPPACQASSSGSAVDLIHLLAQQYLPSQLQALVEQGSSPRRQGAAPPAAAASGGGSADGGGGSAGGSMQGLEAWLEEADLAAAAATGAEVAVASSSFSALGPQVLSALLQLLQLPSLPPQGLRLLGWLLHQLLPVAPPRAPGGTSAAATDGVRAAALQHAASADSTPEAVRSTPLPEVPAADGGGGTAEEDALLRSTSASSAEVARSGSSSSSSAVAGGGGSSAQHSRSSSVASPQGDVTEGSFSESATASPPAAAAAALAACFPDAAEPRGSALSAEQAQQLGAAVAAVRAAFAQQLTSMWCEAVFPLLALEWAASREAMARPVLRSGSDALLSGTAAWPLLHGLQQHHAAGGGAAASAAAAGLEALSVSARAALACLLAVQRVVALTQLHELVVEGAVPRSPPLPTVSEAELRRVDVQEGYQVDLAPGSALPCVVSFAPGQERRVFFAVAGLSRKQLAAIQGAESRSPGGPPQEPSSPHASLLQSLPVAVLADPSPSRPNAGIVLSVAPLLGARPYTDPGVPKWLHVHVRPSVQGLVRVVKTAAKKGGLLAAMRQLADGHWVLAFPAADRAAGAARLVEQHSAHLQRLYRDILVPLCTPAEQQQPREPPQQQQQQEPQSQQQEQQEQEQQEQQQEQPLQQQEPQPLPQQEQELQQEEPQQQEPPPQPLQQEQRQQQRLQGGGTAAKPLPRRLEATKADVAAGAAVVEAVAADPSSAVLAAAE